jgi:hypothetical protein
LKLIGLDDKGDTGDNMAERRSEMPHGHTEVNANAKKEIDLMVTYIYPTYTSYEEQHEQV